MRGILLLAKIRNYYSVQESISKACRGSFNGSLNLSYSSEILCLLCFQFVTVIPLRLPRVLGAMEALAGCRGNLASSSSSTHSLFLASSSRRVVLQSSSSRRRRGVVVVGCPVICSASQKIETEPTKTTSSQPYPGGVGPHTGRDPTVKKPSWLRQRAPQGEKLAKLKESITTLKLNTVCEEAQCPNIGEVCVWLHSHGHFQRRESVLSFFLYFPMICITNHQNVQINSIFLTLSSH